MRYKKEQTGIGVIIGIWLMVIVSCLLVAKDSSDIRGVYVFLGFGGFITLIYIPTLLSTLKFRNKCKCIMDNGTKVQGRIVDYSMDTYSSVNGHERDYSLVVNYLDPYTGEEKSIVTPALAFDPIKSLGTTSCSVYILNDMYYVTDFIRREKGQNTIWWGSKVDIDELEKKELKKIVIYSIIIVLFLVVVCVGGFSCMKYYQSRQAIINITYIFQIITS